MNRKLITVFTAMSFVAVSGVSIADHHEAKKQETTPTQKTDGKRKKKVKVCEECGVAETECDCKGHGHEKKDSKAKDAKHP